MRQAALVTGAALRLGRSIALHLAANGYDIALHYHTSEAEAKRTAQDITALGAVCETIAADLSDTAIYADVVARAQAAFPGLSVLVNSASVFDRAPLLESDAGLFAKEFRINLEAPVFLTQAFAGAVKEGCVVNLLDTQVARNLSPYFFYLLSKKALLAFTQMAATELAPRIRVHGVCPGFVLPPADWQGDYGDRLAARLPMKRLPSVEEVAQTVRLLVDMPATGQIIYVDGGESLL